MTTEQRFDCVFCQETFEDKETLQIHFRKHGDPKFDLGTKIVKTRAQNDTTSVDKTLEDSIEMVGCDVCEEVFPTISKAITHKHKAHPEHDAKYFCPYCGKLFTMKHLHNKHIQSNHDSSDMTPSKDFNCDMCDVSFYVPSAMVYHNKFFHRQDTELPAIGQSKKVKLFSKEMLQIYYCAFCGEEFNNKVNLHKHIGDDHGDENHSPNEVLRCPLCEAIFYHLDAYELHLTFHSSEDLYSEKNELLEQITEFSLETVAPIVENVSDEDNTVTNSDEIGNFLQLVMGENAEDAPSEKIRHKKHKKHKKSKKATITLDEFLNMNKDVFGDGIGDVQGIEEVPTQVVLKKVKNKTQNKNDLKMVNADLAKLKKQGIIIKTKPKKNLGVPNFNTHISKQSNSSINKEKNIATSSTDILSKLLSQGNSQIKIVKKTIPQNIVNEDDGYENPICDVLSNSNEQKNCALQSNEIIKEVSNRIESPSSINDPSFNGQDVKKREDSQKSDNVNNYKKICSSPIEEINTNVASNDVFTNSSQDKLSKSDDDCKHAELNDYCATDKELLSHDKFDNINHENSDNEGDNNDTKKATISALKHLSHLITVKSLANQSKDKLASQIIRNTDEISRSSETHDSNSSKKKNSDHNLTLKKPLKVLNEKVIMKPSGQNSKSTSPVPCPNTQDDDLSNSVESVTEKLVDKVNQSDYLNKNIIYMKELKVTLEPLSHSTCDKFLSKTVSAELSNDPPIHDQPSDGEEDKKDDFSKKETNLDILKRLTNVTAKPVNIFKVTNQKTIGKPCQTLGNQAKATPPKKYSKTIDEELEVYNIDDSDEDNEHNQIEVKQNHQKNIPSDTLRKLPKNITVKSNELKINSNIAKDIKLESNSGRSDIHRENYAQIKQSTDIQKSINLQNKLKTLGNITVKSRNSSPNTFNKEHTVTYDDYGEDEHAEESWSDNEPTGGVKITEINEDDISDNDYDDENPNAVIESPNASNSDDEDNHENFNDDLPDFENQIKINTVKKNNEPTNIKVIPQFDNFKNFNKELTIKSIHTKNAEQEPNSVLQKDFTEDIKNLNNEVATKPLRPNISQSEQCKSKNFQQSTGSLSQNAYNQKNNSSPNQVNVKTVNTVKRFQSQTVIEEITTTVTKTIRTVNSSTNEVMQSTNQNAPTPINRLQKISNKQPGRELQGTAVRHASPTIGTKIRNAIPLPRTPNTSLIRPSNHPVPIRPVYNRPRCPTPSTSIVRKVVPPRCVSQKPAIGKLKISPHALSQTNKRSSDESFGQFNSFKKPKDTCVTSPDIPNCTDDDSSMQYSSMSQNRQDFSSITKNVKGKGMLTSTQVRSEVTQSQLQMSRGASIATQRSETSTCSHQQLSKLSNVSGLKVVKTSSKQSMQVEVSPGKRNTLEALEKLQKQGLLVKKPRIEEFNDQAQSYSDSDDDDDDDAAEK